MRRLKNKSKPNQMYFVGAEVLVDKTKEERHQINAVLRSFGAKEKQAVQWLKSFPPLNTPDGHELKRLVFRLPLGYHEQQDIIAQYKKRGWSHVNARFHMLSDHAGPENTLVYVRGEPDLSNSPRPEFIRGTEEAPLSDTVADAYRFESDGGTGTTSVVPAVGLPESETAERIKAI